MTQDEVFAIIEKTPGMIQTQISVNGEPYSSNVAAVVRKLVRSKRIYREKYIHNGSTTYKVYPKK